MKFDKICKQLFTEADAPLKLSDGEEVKAPSVATPDDAAFDVEPMPEIAEPGVPQGLVEYRKALIKFATTLTALNFGEEQGETSEAPDQASSLLALILKLNKSTDYAGIGSLSKDVTSLSSRCLSLANELGLVSSGGKSTKR